VHPRLSLDGSFAGYIGSCIDITDHKLAEEALAACSINFKGEIIGIAVDPSGATHAYLAIPTPAD
jgi:hypothetical protein